MAGELSIENGIPVRAEGIGEDVLEGLVVLVAGIEFAATARGSANTELPRLRLWEVRSLPGSQ